MEVRIVTSHGEILTRQMHLNYTIKMGTIEENLAPIHMTQIQFQILMGDMGVHIHRIVLTTHMVQAVLMVERKYMWFRQDNMSQCLTTG